MRQRSGRQGRRPRLQGALAALLAAALAWFPLGAVGQGGGPFLSMGSETAVVTLDQERLFRDSAFGQRVESMVQEAAANLAAENRALEQMLTAEEQALTDQRPDLPPEQFRALADAFDARVEEIRRTQDGKNRAIGSFRDAEQQRFFELALPLLAEVVIESGAAAVLDSRAVVLSVGDIDITDRALVRIDAVLGEGGRPDLPVPPGASEDGGVSEPPPHDATPPGAPSADALLPDMRSPDRRLPNGAPAADRAPRPRPAPGGGPPLDLPAPPATTPRATIPPATTPPGADD